MSSIPLRINMDCSDHPSNHLQFNSYKYHTIDTAENADRGLVAPNHHPCHPIRALIISSENQARHVKSLKI